MDVKTKQMISNKRSMRTFSTSIAASRISPQTLMQRLGNSLLASMISKRASKRSSKHNEA